MKLIDIIWMSICSLFFLSCQGSSKGESQMEVSDSLRKSLSGVWLDDNSEAPIFVIRNDSITFLSTGHTTQPARFSISGDTLVIFSSETVKYSIQSLHKHSMRLVTPLGDLLSLHLSETDSLQFSLPVQITQPTEVLRRDSVIQYQGKRFHGYAYINPTRKKVIVQSISEEGLPIDNVYYDNLIHICVYQGKEELYGRDISKEVFQSIVPADFLKEAILTNMDFTGVDSHGYHFIAQLCIPESSTCYYVRVTVDTQGKFNTTLIQ